MYSAVIEWLEVILPSYVMSRGMWVDHSTLNDKFICSVQQSGGAGTDVDVRRPRYRVFLVGPRNGRQHAGQLQTDADKIIQATMDSPPPCGAAIILATSEPMGPGYTTENRAHMQIDLQVTY